jgi:Fur family transcriptional regulator, peroxide stress response regulator
MKDFLQFAQILRKAGLRVTPQRLAICRFLAGTDQHPTAQMIYDEVRPQFPSLSLATVYNTLDTLVQLGMINTLGGAVGEAERFDADTAPHVNLNCVSCDRVIDIPSQHLQALEQDVASQSKYQLLAGRFLFLGLCPECQEKGKRPAGQQRLKDTNKASTG